MKKRATVGIFAYGEMGIHALKGLINNVDILWLIVPPNEITDTNSARKQLEKLAYTKRIQLVKTNSENTIEDLLFRGGRPDAVVISSYSRILPARILKLSKFINIHHGDLPRYRGRANINWAIINGRKEISLVFHEAVEDLDSGNIYKKYKLPILTNDTIATMYAKVNTIIERDIAKIVEKVINGLKGIPQKGISSYCCTRLPEDGLIDWNQKSEKIYNLIRALTSPYPGAFTYFHGKKMIVWDSEIPKNPRVYEGRIPGRVAMIHKNYGVEILTLDSSITIKNINYEGKNINASLVMKSTKNTLGLSVIEIYEKLTKYLVNST